MNNTKDLLHPKTRRQADYFLKKPVGSLLILGGEGSGKLKLAKFIALGLLGLSSVKDLTKYPYFFHVKKPEGKQDISIELVRQIIRFLRLKTPGKNAVRRVVLIEGAHNLSLEAQNAFLKILEEPNDDTVFLLTAPHYLNLLPTIISRCQQIQVHPISLRQASDYYRNQHSQRKVESAWQLSQGQAFLLEAILNNGSKHSLKQAVEQAKEFLTKDVYERLLFLDAMSKNKPQLRQFLEALAKVMAALHHSAIYKNNQKQAQKLLKSRRLVSQVVNSLDNNGNPKLLNLKLVLSLEV